jgi:hypothetical protein
VPGWSALGSPASISVRRPASPEYLSAKPIRVRHDLDDDAALGVEVVDEGGLLLGALRAHPGGQRLGTSNRSSPRRRDDRAL